MVDRKRQKMRRSGVTQSIKPNLKVVSNQSLVKMILDYQEVLSVLTQFL